MNSNNGRLRSVIVGVVLTAFAAQAAWAWVKIVQNGENIAANIPPEWLVDRLDRIELKLDSIESKIGGG